jgi:lysozyme
VPVQRDAFGSIVADDKPIDPLSSSSQSTLYMSPIIKAFIPSERLYAELKKTEGLKLTAYFDYKGYAIGYGNHQYENGSSVKNGDTISVDKANSLLKYVVNNDYLFRVRRLFPNVAFNQNELDALVHSSYNGGISTNLKRAIIYYKQNKIKGEELRAVWENTNLTAGGQKLTELVRRRKFEADWFLTGYTPTRTGIVETVEEVETTQQVPTGTFDTVIDETQVLNNFRVDKEIFNFFLRKQHFDFRAAKYGAQRSSKELGIESKRLKKIT